ncbi:hypothetical protein [Oleiagrimonas sp.]|uniref:hypothetical protein n=1 Tax=Oleiagrimonas sp. TaxID=2010330 RepID=UPI002626BB46|nr:hypothetical protein [Oleiagrimonas sp.]MDA3913286.1 hypothetical protein [Oleiagrimonas sp.]
MSIKVVAASLWFTTCASDTEVEYRIHAERFRGPDRLGSILDQLQGLMEDALS